MKKFYKNQYRIIVTIVLTLIFQILGPIAGSYLYVNAATGQGFELKNTTIEDGKATIDWMFTLTSDETAKNYDNQLGFGLNKEVSGSLVADNEMQTNIGQYVISEEGELLVEIDDSIYDAFRQDPETLGRLDDRTSDGAIGTLTLATIIFTGSFQVDGVTGESPPMMLGIPGDDLVSFNDVTLQHIDEQGDPMTGDFQVGSHVKIRFSYRIEDIAQVDIEKLYEFTIPKEIPILTDRTLELKDGSRVLANIEITQDSTGVTGGFMTVQFLAEINNEAFDEERNGWIEITSQFGNITIGDDGEQTITFEVNGASKDVTVKFEEVKETQNVILSKSGNYDKVNNEILWTIKVTPKTTPKGKIIKKVIIKDTIQPGQTYIPESAKLGGASINPDPVTNDKLEYQLNTIQDGNEYFISFKTKPDLSQFVTQGEKIIFENTVTGTFGEEENPTNESGASVDTTVNFIEKSGEEVTEVTGQGKIKWTININNNNLELPIGTSIEDTIGTGLAFNNDLLINGEPFGNYGTLNVEGQKLTFTFINPISTMHTLTYTTNVTDSGAYDSNDRQTYKNEAEITWPNKPGGATSTGEIGIGVYTSIIQKTVAGYNKVTHEITWKIVINTNKIKITNPVITDKLPATLEYVDHTISGNKAWDFTNNNNDLRFTHTGEINEPYTITLVTRIKDEHKEYFGNNSTEYISNTAILTGTGVKKSESTATQTVTSKVIAKSGKGYDYTTRKAKWEIIVNQNKMLITNATVTDVIQDGFHEFVAGSLKIDSVDATPGQYSVNGNTITITLGDITTQKKITFETQIPENKVDEFFQQNSDKKLKNNATLTGDEIHGKVEVKASQIVKNTVISKRGNYESGTDFIDWEVIINSNRLVLSGVVLEDTLQEGLILDTTSVKVNKLNVNPEGTYVEDSEKPITTTYGPVTNHIKFTVGDINDAYILRFRTDIHDDFNNQTFKNTIKLQGSNGAQNGVSTAVGVRFQTGDAGGSGTSTRGSLTVIKSEGKTPLQGAKFELLKADQTTVIETSSETLADGTILFDNLRMGIYYIKEIQAPEGYVLDETLKKVELRKGVETKYVTYTFENKKITGDIEFIKTDDEENPLSGAWFNLYNQTDEAFEYPLNNGAISDETGRVRFEQIPYGQYVIKEILAPIGYEPSNKVIEVEIKAHKQLVTLEDIINKKIIGDLEIIKVSRNVEPSEGEEYPPDQMMPRILKVGDYIETLEGAEFELWNKNKTYAATTDENGRIVFQDIAHGTYTLKETKAPRGYLLSDETYEVEISEYGQEIIRLIIGNQKIKGSLEILKVDEDNKRPLSGASFTLYDTNMNKQEEVITNKDGKAVF